MKKNEEVALKEQEIPLQKENTENTSEMRQSLKEEILKDLGIEFLKNKVQESEVKEIVAPVVEPVGLEKPKKIIYEIKGVVEENHVYNGAFVAGKIVGKHPFYLVQPVGNRNVTFERENDYYITGLEPEFYENLGLDQEVLNKRLNEIKLAKAYLEKKYNKSLSPKNFNFWENIRFSITDIGLVYSTHKATNNANEDHLLMYYIILGGGCEDIATSYEDAKAWGKMYYLTVREEETVRNFSSTKTKLAASSMLQEVMQNWSKEDQLFLLYSLDTNVNHGYTLDTPSEMIIGELDDFITAKNFKTDKKQKSQDFMKVYEQFNQDSDLVKIKGLFNAAEYFGFITSNRQTKELHNRLTGFNYGSSVQGALDKLMNPKNIEELSFIKKKVMDKWKS
jgi:hypothetical protein